MNRTKPIAALEKAQKYAASLNNPSVEAFKAQGGKVIGRSTRKFRLKFSKLPA